MRKPKIPLDEIRARYEAGETLKDLAKDAGVSYQTVRRRLEDMGVDVRGKIPTKETLRKRSETRRLDLPEERIRELHAREMSCREMAAILGCNEETVRERLIELDLPRLPGKARPEKNAFWRGGYTVDTDGYILERRPDHPHADKHGYVRQHRLVMEQTLGRYLTKREVVDHRDTDTSNNVPSNLRLFASNAEHLRATLTGEKVSRRERARLKREAVQRARQRVAAILAASGNDADR